jgi:hypothetical protein
VPIKFHPSFLALEALVAFGMRREVRTIEMSQLRRSREGFGGRKRFEDETSRVNRREGER